MLNTAVTLTALPGRARHRHSAEFPKPWTDQTVGAAGCGDACPRLHRQRYESWDDLDDPPALDLAAVRPPATTSNAGHAT